MEKFAVRENPGSPISEAYRKIAANIEFANIDNDIKTVMVTSSLAYEGKTTTISNIASVMAELNKKILLVDLDLRKPSVHKEFKLSNKTGLADLLLHKDDFNKYINSVYKGLDVMTSGKIPSNPTEIINSKAIKETIKELSNHYDYIFIDTPPVILVSDPITISSYTDAVIVVVGYGETEKDILKKSIDSLKQVNANIIGTVLNKMPVNKKSKYYYYYKYK